MKTAVKYVNDQKGKFRRYQLPISHWTRLMNRLNKYEANAQRQNQTWPRPLRKLRKCAREKLKNNRYKISCMSYNGASLRLLLNPRAKVNQKIPFA